MNTTLVKRIRIKHPEFWRMTELDNQIMMKRISKLVAKQNSSELLDKGVYGECFNNLFKPYREIISYYMELKKRGIVMMVSTWKGEE